MKRTHFQLFILVASLLLLSFSNGYAITLDIRVNAGADDAETWNNGSNDLDLGQNYAGVRFQGITIPAIATITNAYIIFDSRSNRAGGTSVTIYGENNVTPNSFATADPHLRPHTATSVAWNNIPAWSTNEVSADTTTPDLSAIIQEIIQLPGWTPGNPIVFVMSDDAGRREARTFNDNPARAPLLHIEYTTVDVTSPTISGVTGNCITMTEVIVTFSEDVDAVTAETATNYSLDNGVTISAATLTASDTITLTTSALTDSTTYTLTVNNVEDLAGNVITAGSTSPFFLNCSNLIAHYRMDEDFWDGTANEVVDQSGNALHGTAVGGVTTSEAKVCNGAILDGITLAYVEVADDPLLDIPDELTVSLWLNTNVIPTSGLKSILSKDQNYEFHITTGGRINWWWNNSGGATRQITTASSVSIDTWHHIAIAYSRSAASQTIYIDGVADVNTSSYSEGLFQDNDPLQIGGDQAFVSREFDGLIDEVRIYEKAQTQAEIQADMNTTRPCGTVACSFRDDFTSISYNNQDGLLNWSSDWVEAQDNNNPASGDAYISGGRLTMNNDTGSGGTTPVLTRELDLTGASAATLSFIFSTSAGTDTGDSFRVQVSGDGGGSWTTLETINGNGSPKTEIRSYPINAYIAPNTQIRLLIQSGYTAFNEDVYFYYVNVAPIGLCGGTNVDHYSINHDTSGINCQAEPITISVHDAAHAVIAGHTGTITLSTSTSHGDWSVITGNPANLVNSGNGDATYTFDGSELGVLVLGLKDTFVETININVTDGTATELTGSALATEDLDLVFAQAGFNFLADGVMNSIGNQIGGKPSNTTPGSQVLEIEAIRTSDDTGQCEAALVGANTIQLAFECLDPATCTANLANISGTDIAANNGGSVVAYTGVTLDFGTNLDTTATFTMTYPDVGQLRLHAQYNIPLGSGPGSGNLMIGASNSFIVRPFGFDISAVGNPAATTAAGAVYTPAGTLFAANVRAVLWEAADDGDNDGIPDNHTDIDPDNNADLTGNTAALNFGQEATAEDVALTSYLFLPAGVNPPLAGTTTVTGFTNGVSASNVRYDEVGIIELIANLTDNSYLGDGSVTGRSSHVGRFTPDHFDVTISPDPPAFTDSCVTGNFTYLGEAFTFQANPVVTITAFNAATPAAITQNYDCGNFWMLPDPLNLAYTYSDSSIGGTALTPLGNTVSPGVGDTTNCSGFVDLTLTDNFTYARPSYAAPVNPFAASVDLTIAQAQITDSDTICFDTGSGCQSFTKNGIAGANLRHGRIQVFNNFGPETEDITDSPFEAQYFDGTDWVTHVNDDCSTGLVFCSAPAAGRVTAIQPDPLSTGQGTFTVTTSGTSGEVLDVCTTSASWLTDLVDCTTPDDTCGEFTFGIYRGNDRIINWREIVR